MILVADSGSTKTEWRLIYKGKEVLKEYTEGLNPYYQSVSSIEDVLQRSTLFKGEYSIRKVLFYGAGCGSSDNKVSLAKSLAKFLPHSEIHVFTDILGAARGLAGNNPGIVCILGTGSNSCYYDGNQITENVPSLGFILGDEGSGAFMGKRLIVDYLRKDMPFSVREKLEEEYLITTNDVLKNIYSKENPSRYLARFAPFILQNIEDEYLFKLVEKNFTDFFDAAVCKYDMWKSVPVHFTGSISYHFKDCLHSATKKYGINVGNIEKNPCEKLTLYHIND